MLFALVLLLVFTVSAVIILWYEIDYSNLRIKFLEENIFKMTQKLSRLEKDAVKITFTEPYSSQEVKNVHKSKPLTEGDIKGQHKRDVGPTQGPPPPRPPKKENVLGEWQIKNGSPFKKRKPKTIKDWEEEIDLGGHE